MMYEVIREIFNLCSNNQMRDVFVEEREIADTDEYMRAYFCGKQIELEKTLRDDGTILYDVVVDGLRQRFSFSP